MNLQIDIRLKRNNFNLFFKGEMPNGITGLFGPSGAGKTTLLHCIAGLTHPDSGRIVLNDNVLYDSFSHHYLPPEKRQIGLVFQDHLLFPHMTVRRNLSFGQKNKISKERKNQLCEIAELLEITHLLNRNVRSLSGGEKQRVALGRAILSSPKLLMLDEPFAALDQELKRQLIPYLRRLYEITNIPMILVSHSTEDIAGLTDKVVFMENGQFVAHGKFTYHRSDHPIGRLCGSGNSEDYRRIRNHLIRNHGLRFSGAEKKTKAV